MASRLNASNRHAYSITRLSQLFDNQHLNKLYYIQHEEKAEGKAEGVGLPPYTESAPGIRL